jgi:hypothetical protein
VIPIERADLGRSKAARVDGNWRTDRSVVASGKAAPSKS